MYPLEQEHPRILVLLEKNVRTPLQNTALDIYLFTPAKTVYLQMRNRECKYSRTHSAKYKGD